MAKHGGGISHLHMGTMERTQTVKWETRCCKELCPLITSGGRGEEEVRKREHGREGGREGGRESMGGGGGGGA